MQDLLDDFKQTIDQASRRLIGISEQQSAVPGAVGKWSPKEIIGHLIDSAANNHERFVRAQLTDDLVFPGYEQEEWVRVQRYNERGWHELVQLWRHYNVHLLHVMATVDEISLRQQRTQHNLHQIAWKAIPQQEPATLEYFMRDYVAHMKHHLDQILVA